MDMVTPEWFIVKLSYEETKALSERLNMDFMSTWFTRKFLAENGVDDVPALLAAE